MTPFHGRKPSQLMEPIRNSDWNKVVAICQATHCTPRQVKHWSRVKLTGERECVVMLPLHYAIIMTDGSKESLNAVQALIDVYPHSLECKESNLQRTPLHLACIQTDASEQLIKLLLDKRSEAAMELDHLQRLPLHYACANKNLMAIQTVVGAYPEATAKRDGQGWLPLHVACHYESDFELIQFLLQINPDAVIAKTPLDKETTMDLVKKQGHFKDKHEIMDLLAEKEKYYVPTPHPFMDSFVTDNFLHPIY